MRTVPLNDNEREQAILLKVVGEGSSEVTYVEEIRRFVEGRTFKPYDAKGGDIPNVRKETKRRIGKGPGVVIMDTDRNENEDLREFKRWCDSRGIILLISNPSFEVWLLMHFRDVTSNMSKEDLKHALTDCLGRKYEKKKGIRPKRMMLVDAVRRAKLKIPKGEDVFDYVLMTPGTTMVHLLFEE